MDYPIAPDTDLIAVLGSASHADGSASAPQIRRCRVALDIWQANKTALILVMGGAVANPIVEADTMAGWLINQGVPESRILKDRETINTRSQGLFLGRFAENYRPRSLTVVSDQSHLRRTRMLLLHAGLKPDRFEMAGAEEPTNVRYRARSFLYENLNYAKDWLRTLLGIW
jgi:uncharacterized SAM-binding protein YcdF (DUF218 family)